jgi:hypothetical protein
MMKYQQFNKPDAMSWPRFILTILRNPLVRGAWIEHNYIDWRHRHSSVDRLHPQYRDWHVGRFIFRADREWWCPFTRNE